MSHAQESNSGPRGVAVHLLDMSTGRQLKSWTFHGRPHLCIGRSHDCDVQISDPYVSRNHAELRYHSGGWQLVSVGRSGVVVAGQLVDELPVAGDLIFRLGPDGPTLKFEPAAIAPADFSKTMYEEVVTAPSDAFDLDTTKLSREVREIAEGDYFKSLQQRAKQLRENRGTS